MQLFHMQLTFLRLLLLVIFDLNVAQFVLIALYSTPFRTIKLHKIKPPKVVILRIEDNVATRPTFEELSHSDISYHRLHFATRKLMCFNFQFYIKNAACIFRVTKFLYRDILFRICEV